MIHKKILNAIYANHLYEYCVINQDFKVIEHSDNIFNYYDKDTLKETENNIFELLPELFGMQKQLQAIFEDIQTSLVIPLIFKEPDYYINILIHHGERVHQNKTLIILLENVTEMTNIQQNVIQISNENALLLQELAKKNKKLEAYNAHMQELVDAEIKKNLEKQKMVEVQSRHSQMGEIIGMITHQWKQPLNAINMIANVLKLKYHKGTLDNNVFNTKIDNILKQADYMDETVDVFQRFFKPTKEKIEFNLFKTITIILDLVQHEYALKHINLELKGDQAILVTGYPNEYNQVILAILNNAKDAFLTKPHETMHISITVENKDGNSLVTIRDNAGGIPEDIINNIFDLYMTTKSQGTGLGLNIAKSVIELNMQGQISVQNVKDGAEFSIVL